MSMTSRRAGSTFAAFATMLVGFALHSASAAAQATSEYGYPLVLAPRPTAVPITEADLMTRLYIFADDSMQGRQAGRIGNQRGTAYIARELERLGLEPAGENGSFFQSLPYAVRKYTERSTFAVDGRALGWLSDFVAVPGRDAPAPLNNVPAVYGGVLGDTARMLAAGQAAGKAVVFSPAEPGGRGGRGGRGGFAGGAISARLEGALAVIVADLNNLPLEDRAALNDPPGSLPRGGGPGGRGAQPSGPQPASMRITTDVANAIFGRPINSLTPGTNGARITANLDFVEQPVPNYGRNVIAIIRGSDPALAGQYVALGAHNDHVGYTTNPVDHDSARAAATAALRMQMAGGELRSISAEERANIRVNVDSLRRLRPARLDSIRNGADDDGSGSMALLEIAEAIASAPTKPRRSILFVWHTGEEGGLSGSRWFVENPTVPRDSIVAQINIDMIGRGRASDIPGGGNNYLAVVGSRRLSSELGNLVADVNQKLDQPLQLDYRFDEQTTWPGYNNIYGRSDHANYARYNIPIAFFFTGLHQDYHQVTDEPQYIDYPHYTAITQYIHRLVLEIAERERRLVVDRANS